MAAQRVSELMTSDVVTVTPDTSAVEIARRLSDYRISAIPVVENDGSLAGIVSESDLIAATMPPVAVDRGASILDFLSVLVRARPRAHVHGKTAKDIMSRMVFSVSDRASIWTAASLMERHGVKRLPVLDRRDKLVGIISRADLVRAMASQDTDVFVALGKAIEILGEDAADRVSFEVDDGVVSLYGTTDRKSTHDIIVHTAELLPGVVAVIDELAYDVDDSRFAHMQPIVDPKDPRLDWLPSEV